MWATHVVLQISSLAESSVMASSRRQCDNEPESLLHSRSLEGREERELVPLVSRLQHRPRNPRVSMKESYFRGLIVCLAPHRTDSNLLFVSG